MLNFPKPYRIILSAISVGLLVGIVTSLFRKLIDLTIEFQKKLETFGALSLPLTIFISVIGVVIAVFLVRRFGPEAKGSGVPQIELALNNGDELRSFRVIVVKFFSALLAIGSGLVLGREGPSIHIGGAIGSFFGAGRGKEVRRLLIASGAGAGLAAAFNAPLAGMFFILEELRQKLSKETMITAFISCAIACIVQQEVFGQGPIFNLALEPIPPINSLPQMFLLGIFVGLVAAVFIYLLLKLLTIFKGSNYIPSWLKGALVVTLLVSVSRFYPHITGEGHSIILNSTSEIISLEMAFILLLLRLFSSTLSYACGTAGGIFSPMLVIGALVGICFYYLLNIMGYSTLSPIVYIVVAMSALFSGVVRAPITGIVLIIEMTGEDTLILPLLIASGASYFIVELFKVEPIYDSLKESKY